MRPSKDETWLNVAHEVSRQTTCLRRAVGCVLVSARGHVLATGYNGVAAGQPHCNEVTGWVDFANRVPQHGNACLGAGAPSGTRLDECEAIHAEANALLQCRDPWAIDVCYVTTAPCVSCVKLLLGTSCARVVFAEHYAHEEPAARLFMKGRGARSWERLELK